MNKIWQHVALPEILYRQQLKLERIQRDLGKHMVHGHKGCTIIAIYGELGWIGISHNIPIKVLNFFGHLDPERWSQIAF